MNQQFHDGAQMALLGSDIRTESIVLILSNLYAFDVYFEKKISGKYRGIRSIEWCAHRQSVISSYPVSSGIFHIDFEIYVSASCTELRVLTKKGNPPWRHCDLRTFPNPGVFSLSLSTTGDYVCVNLREAILVLQIAWKGGKFTFQEVLMINSGCSAAPSIHFSDVLLSEFSHIKPNEMVLLIENNNNVGPEGSVELLAVDMVKVRDAPWRLNTRKSVRPACANLANSSFVSATVEPQTDEAILMVRKHTSSNVASKLVSTSAEFECCVIEWNGAVTTSPVIPNLFHCTFLHPFVPCALERGNSNVLHFFHRFSSHHLECFERRYNGRVAQRRIPLASPHHHGQNIMIHTLQGKPHTMAILSSSSCPSVELRLLHVRSSDDFIPRFVAGLGRTDPHGLGAALLSLKGEPLQQCLDALQDVNLPLFMNPEFAEIQHELFELRREENKLGHQLQTSDSSVFSEERIWPLLMGAIRTGDFCEAVNLSVISQNTQMFNIVSEAMTEEQHKLIFP